MPVVTPTLNREVASWSRQMTTLLGNILESRAQIIAWHCTRTLVARELKGPWRRVPEEKYGKILRLLKIKVKSDALATLMQFYDVLLRCFTFKDFQLAPTLEEYEHILGMPIDESSVYFHKGYLLSWGAVARLLKRPEAELIEVKRARNGVEGLPQGYLEGEMSRYKEVAETKENLALNELVEERRMGEEKEQKAQATIAELWEEITARKSQYQELSIQAEMKIQSAEEDAEHWKDRYALDKLPRSLRTVEAMIDPFRTLPEIFEFVKECRTVTSVVISHPYGTRAKTRQMENAMETLK
ncbi:hypothetical protein CR513_36848, partial [Mucuna pruriens]